jgi:hypothetical protein
MKQPKRPLGLTKPKKVADTTKIAEPYKVTGKEYNQGYFTKDSTAKKMMYNAQKVVPSMQKRNAERRKEGKPPISYQSITGSPVIPFSNKGKSDKDNPLIRKK